MNGIKTIAAPGEAVAIFDGVVAEENERSLAVPIGNDGAATGVGVSADELKRMVEIDEERREIIRNYIARNLKTGIDYGTIPMPGRETKPSLFKPGAEKICMLLQLRAEFEPDQATLQMAGNATGLFAYVCRLLDRHGRVVGEGRGAAEIGEKRGWTVNNAIKICEKRAQIDAVLRVVCLSEIFTQDLEDLSQRAVLEGGARRPNAELPSAPKRYGPAEEMCGDDQERQIRALLPRAAITEGELLLSLEIASIRHLTRNKAHRVIDRLNEKARLREKG